uniref:Uncharacterized protein n=1 Tax=Xenopus tropicalis TaxID=8364 RepID=A0A1B8XUI1_XENTR
MLSLIFQMSMLYSPPLSCSLFFPEHHTISHYFSCSLFLIHLLAEPKSPLHRRGCVIWSCFGKRDTDKPEANDISAAPVQPEGTGKCQCLYLQTSPAPPEYLLHYCH